MTADPMPLGIALRCARCDYLGSGSEDFEIVEGTRLCFPCALAHDRGIDIAAQWIPLLDDGQILLAYSPANAGWITTRLVTGTPAAARAAAWSVIDEFGDREHLHLWWITRYGTIHQRSGPGARLRRDILSWNSPSPDPRPADFVVLHPDHCARHMLPIGVPISCAVTTHIDVAATSLLAGCRVWITDEPKATTPANPLASTVLRALGRPLPRHWHGPIALSLAPYADGTVDAMPSPMLSTLDEMAAQT